MEDVGASSLRGRRRLRRVVDDEDEEGAAAVQPKRKAQAPDSAVERSAAATDPSPVKLRRRRLRVACDEDGEEGPAGLRQTREAEEPAVPAVAPSQQQGKRSRLKRLKEFQQLSSAEEIPAPQHPSQPSQPKQPKRRPARKAAAAANAWRARLGLGELEDEDAEEEKEEEEDDGEVKISSLRRRSSRRVRGLSAETLGLGADEGSLGTQEPEEEEEEEERPARRRRADARPPAPPPPRALSSSGLVDSEESDGEGAEALSRSIKGAASANSAKFAVRRRMAVDLGTDDDPEVSEWKQDLEDRWSRAAEPRPIAAFSKEPCGPEVVRKLPAEHFLAGCPIFDAEGKVNIPWLLGAHKQLLAAVNSSSSSATGQSPAVRQVGWLARKARGLGLIDDGELRNGRVGRGKGRVTVAPPRSQSCPELLMAAQEVRFPARPTARKKQTSSGDKLDAPSQGASGKDDNLFSDDEEGEDEVERFLRRKQAVAALKSRTDGRQAQIGARSSHDINMRDVKSSLLAPSLSFDLSAKADEDDDTGSGEELEVALPEQQKPRKDSRRVLLKEQLQKKLRMAMAKGLAPEPAPSASASAAENSSSTAPTTDAAPVPTTSPAKAAAVMAPEGLVAGEELELEVEGEGDQKPPSAPEEDEDADVLKERRRRRRRVVEDDEDDEAAAPATGSTVPADGSPAKTAEAAQLAVGAGAASADTEISTQAETAEVRPTPEAAAPATGSAAPADGSPTKTAEATASAKPKQKQASLKELFAAKSPKKEEAQGLPQAEKPPQESDSKEQPPPAPATEAATASELAERPRPLKRLRPATLEQPEVCDETQEPAMEPDADMEEAPGGEEAESEDGEDEGLGEEWYEEEESFEEEEMFTHAADAALRRRRRSFLRQKRLEAVKHKRRLDWEVDDAEELRTEADRFAHLGTSTMSDKDRERWEGSILSTAPAAASAGVQVAAAGSKGNVIWARGAPRGDDDASQLYSAVGRPCKKASFLGGVQKHVSPVP